MSKDPQLWHYGTVIHDDWKTIEFDKPFWLRNEIGSKIGKRIRMLIEEVKIEKTPPQLALYFGVIIKVYCMANEQFGGWTEREIDDYFRQRLRWYEKTIVLKDGTHHIQPCVDDIRLYSKDQMTKYLNDVLDLLAQDHEIFIEDPHLFKLNKYVQDTE